MKEIIETGDGDLVLQELGCAKDQLSASYDHDLAKLLTITRGNEKLSGHQIVNFENEIPKDYLAQRDKMFEGETVDSLFAQLKTLQKAEEAQAAKKSK